MFSPISHAARRCCSGREAAVASAASAMPCACSVCLQRHIEPHRLLTCPACCLTQVACWRSEPASCQTVPGCALQADATGHSGTMLAVGLDYFSANSFPRPLKSEKLIFRCCCGCSQVQKLTRKSLDLISTLFQGKRLDRCSSRVFSLPQSALQANAKAATHAGLRATQYATPDRSPTGGISRF